MSMSFKCRIIKPHIQWIAAFAVFILMTQVGICIGWSAPNIAKLTASDSDIPLDDAQVSWIVSIGSLVGILGAIVGALGIECLGSRMTVFWTFVFMSVSWICIIIADSVIWLYVARGLTGIVLSASYSCFSLYLGEIADPKIRGTLVSMASCGNPFGIVVGTIVETYLPRKMSSSIYLLQCLVGLVLLIWLKDTPYYLIKRDKIDHARASIAFYHFGCDVKKEILEIKKFVEGHTSVSKRSVWNKFQDLNTTVVRKSMFLIITLFALPHLSGTIVVASYMEVILKKGKSNLIDPKQFVIYANVTNVVTSLLTFKLIDLLGRKVLLAVSGVGTAVSMMGLGIHFYLLNDGFDPEKLEWLPVASLLGYLITYVVGFSPVPSTVLSELFTDNIKSTAALVATLSAPFFSFIVTKTYQPLVDLIGVTYVFWIYAVLSLLAVPFALFLLPETKGKTFQEIQEGLIGK